MERPFIPDNADICSPDYFQFAEPIQTRRVVMREFEADAPTDCDWPIGTFITLSQNPGVGELFELPVVASAPIDTVVSIPFGGTFNNYCDISLIVDGEEAQGLGVLHVTADGIEEYSESHDDCAIEYIESICRSSLRQWMEYFNGNAWRWQNEARYRLVTSSGLIIESDWICESHGPNCFGSNHEENGVEDWSRSNWPDNWGECPELTILD
jgi:hypothetical protein